MTDSGAKQKLAAGVVLAGRYKLDRLLGEGGMGVVWAATHVVTRKPVALKLLSGDAEHDPRFHQRFLREARAASAVRHPNVVTIHDVLELENGTPVMVMELLLGESLGTRIDREVTLSVADAARILLPVVSAVGTAHELGIVHRDLKPDNIFLVNGAEGMEVKVVDFGIAKLTATEGEAAQTGHLTGTGAMLGTPYYMAPEQIFGDKDIDHRADVWALGIILFECLTGKRPTQGDNVGQILKIVTTGKIAKLAVVAPELPAELSALVDRMLQLDREARPTLQEVAATLRRHSDVKVRTFGAPRDPAIVRGDTPTTADTGNRISIRSGDVVNPMEATQAAPDRSGEHAPTLGASAIDTRGVRDARRGLRATALAVAVAVVGGGIFIATRFSHSPPEHAAPSSPPPLPALSVSVASPAVTSAPAAAPTVVPSASAPIAATRTPPNNVKAPPSATTSSKPVAPPTVAPVATPSTPGGVVEKPPF